MSIYPPSVNIVEVGPRDGLQNESNPLSIPDRVHFINNLSKTGLKVIEAGSFVSPKWVSQMADTGHVYQQITQAPGVSYPVLVPNEKGMEMAGDLRSARAECEGRVTVDTTAAGIAEWFATTEECKVSLAEYLTAYLARAKPTTKEAT